jgi:hypothetical protein
MPAASRDKQPVDVEEQKPVALDPRDARIAELEAQLAEIKRPPASADFGLPARLKVEAPHSELHYAGRVIGTEFTEVPANMLAAYMEAADNAGVTLTMDQES